MSDHAARRAAAFERMRLMILEAIHSRTIYAWESDALLALVSSLENQSVAKAKSRQRYGFTR